MPPPDLVPTALSGPSSAVAGQQIQVSWTVANQGTGPASGSWSDRLFLNTVAAAGGTALVRLPHTTTVVPGDHYDVVNQTVTLPSVTAGSYFLVLQTDGFSVVFEQNESNNVSAQAITITP